MLDTKDRQETKGTVVQIIGAVVDVEFDQDHVPKIHSAIIVDDSGLTLEVQQQLGDGVVRCIAMGSTDGMKRNIDVSNTGHPIRVPVGVAYGSDLKLLQQLLLEAAGEHPKALRDPSPVVLFNEFGDNSLNFELGVWTQEMTAAPIHFTSEMNFIIEQKLRENDIEIPFPQRDLHVRSGLPAAAEASSEG
jgi:hypothetical protein